MLLRDLRDYFYFCIFFNWFAMDLPTINNKQRYQSIKSLSCLSLCLAQLMPTLKIMVTELLCIIYSCLSSLLLMKAADSLFSSEGRRVWPVPVSRSSTQRHLPRHCNSRSFSDKKNMIQRVYYSPSAPYRVSHGNKSQGRVQTIGAFTPKSVAK